MMGLFSANTLQADYPASPELVALRQLLPVVRGLPGGGGGTETAGGLVHITQKPSR